METEKEATPIEETFVWKVDDPAPEDEKATFWKELRHFYRTGEKPNVDIKSETSALLKLVGQGKSSYPFALSSKASVELSEQTPFVVLNHVLNEHQKDKRREFKGRLSELIEGLNRLLKVDDPKKEADKLHGAFDFANELIAFDRMAEIIPSQQGKELGESRLKRIQSIVETMQTGLQRYHDQVANVVIEQKLKGQLEQSGVLRDAVLITISEDVFTDAQALFGKEMTFFTELIKAYRIASLEVTGDYNESIHDEYFDHFHWHRFLSEELQLFPPIVTVVDHEFVFNHLSSFSRLLVSNQPVTTLVLNHQQVSVPKENVSWEDASHQSRQELAAQVISHRNAYYLQAGIEDPTLLVQGLNDAIDSIAPAVCHLSVPHAFDSQIEEEILRARAASAGRYFVRSSYDSTKDTQERLDISMNIQPDQFWPKYALIATKGDSDVEFDVSFTYADYKAAFSEKAKELMLVPSKYYDEHLIPLGEYMELEEESLYGVVPYIWLTNDQNELVRAAVPYVWVVSCQERMDFWKYLKELEGVRMSEVPATAEITSVESAKLSNTQLVQIQEEAMSKAAERLIAALLTDEELGAS